MSSEAPKAPAQQPPQRSRSRPTKIKPPITKGKSNKLFYSLAGIASLFVVGGLCYFGYELTKPTKKPSTKKTGSTSGKVNKTKQARPKGDYYDIVVKRGPGQAIGIMLCPGENKTQGAFVAACKANIDLGLKIGSQLVEINGKWLDSDMNFKETAQLLAKSCSPEGKLCFKEISELNNKWTKADKTKTEGNELYKKKQIDLSIAKYSDAIKLHPTNKVYYSNKVLALLSKAEHCTGEKTPIYYEALADCRVMRELDVFDNYQKGHHVRGVVLLHMGKFKHARTAFQTVLRIDPKNKKALARLKDCQQAIADDAQKAELEKKSSAKESAPEQKQQASATEEKALEETTDAIKQPKKSEGNEVPVAPSTANGPGREAEDGATTEKRDTPSLLQMVEDLKQEVNETGEIPDKSKDSSEIGANMAGDVVKDGVTRKESVPSTIPQLVEDSTEEVTQDQEGIIADPEQKTAEEPPLEITKKPEQKTVEETPSENTKKPEEVKDIIVEEVKDEVPVYQNETHSSVPLEEKEADHPATTKKSNTLETATEKTLTEQSKMIVEDMVKTTMERAVGELVESGGELVASRVEGGLPGDSAEAVTTKESIENSVTAATTTNENLVEGEIDNTTLVQN